MSLEDFEFGKELGKGAFGSVTIVKRLEDNKIYAMKRVKIGRLGKKEKDNSFNEVRLLASLDHKNIIGYKEAFFDDKSKTLNIVMEYADGGDLSTKIKEYRKKNIYFEEETIWSTLIQILEGLKYLHQSCIIHRDLKSANIFLTKSGCVKIGDLNVSKILNRMRTASTQTGTPYFASPEIWNDQPYDYKCDIWSVGCIIYEMCALHVPFRGTSMQNLYQNVLRGIYQQISLRYSDDLRKIIKQILVVNPKNRPSSSELLENPIIKKKILELGLNKDNKKTNEEKARLMKTIKIPMNMSQINNELPQKKYEKEKMLLNDEYETAKRTFYNPPTINNNNNNINNYNVIDNNKNNNENNKNILMKNHLDNNIMNNKQLDEQNFIENLIGKDLNNIKNIIKNIDNNDNLKHNYINKFLNKNNSKSLKNLDNDEEKNKNNMVLNNKYLEIEEANANLIKYKPKIRDHNKYSNINYDYILNEKENMNRIIKTDMNQININNNSNNPFIKNEEIIKTEISNYKNNNIGQTKENKNIENEKKEKEKINNNINNIQISILEKKKGKNKNKKINNITLKEKNNISNENSNQIPLKEEIANLPVLRPIIDKKKDIIEFEFESEEKDLKNNQKERNDQDINEEVVKLLLEGYEDNNKYKDTNNKLSKNGSLELEFGEIINKEFSELNQKNIRTKVIKGILSSIKTNNIINYNPRINGPYLVGSYKTIPELPSINYLSPIDIMYTYKDILIDKKIIDYTINNIIKNYLNLNIIEKSESFEDDNKIIKIKVKCTNKINLNVIISFNIIFFDLEQNEKIINDIILDNETIIYENKEEHKKFINIILYLRVWRKKNKLFFIIPEIIDRIAKKHFDKNKNMGVVILNVFYDLYNGIIDFNSKINQGVLPKHKILMENIIKNWFNNEKNCEMIKKSILETNRLINNKNFHVLFNKEDI